MNQGFVALIQHPGGLGWPQDNLASAGQIVPTSSANLEELLALLNIATAGVLFISLDRNNLVSQGTLAGGSAPAWPMLSAVATGDGLDDQLVLAAMRAGARDFITYGACVNELIGLVRHLDGYPPNVPVGVARRGEPLTLANTRLNVDDTFIVLHLAKALREQTPNQALLPNVGQPTSKALAILDLGSTLTFSNALYNLRHLDQILVNSAFTRPDSGLWILSLIDEPGILERVTTTELYLLLGSLRGVLSHVVVNLTRLPEGKLSNQLLVQINHVLWMVNWSIPPYKKGLERLHHLCERNLPLPFIKLLIERYLPDTTPDQRALGRMFDLDLFGVLPLSPESRLHARNLSRSLLEVAPRNPLAAKLRQLTDSLCMTCSERRSLSSWLGRTRAALLRTRDPARVLAAVPSTIARSRTSRR